MSKLQARSCMSHALCAPGYCPAKNEVLARDLKYGNKQLLLTAFYGRPM